MPEKQKNIKKLSSIESIRQDQRKERKMIAEINAKNQLLKWLLLGVIILLLLLILFAGYATDWLRGVNKDNTVTPVSSSLDSVKDTAGAGSKDSSSGNTSASDAATTNKTNSTGTNDNSKTSQNNATSRETTTTTNTTNTVIPSPAPDPVPTTAPAPGLLSLYADSSVGDDISSILNQAQLLGLSKNCHTNVLIQVCEITDGALVVTTKNLLGTGIVTSLTKNF